ncbi:FAD binding domain-containing protein [Bordetella sp. 2513F-2]
MKPGKFAYYEPTSVEQACVMLADVADHDGRVIAGGQTLVPAMALRYAQPAYLIDINGIAALRELSLEDDALVVRACVRHAAFHQPVVQGPLGELLATVVRHIAHLPIRNRGTFCGSLANADPASEWCLVAATLEAGLEVASVRGTRTVLASAFFQGYMATALAPDELLVAARLPRLAPATRFGFDEFSRRAGDFAQAMALATLELHDGVMRHVRLGVGAVEAKPRRLAEAEAMLEGRAPDAAVVAAAAQAAAESVEPVDADPAEQRYRRRLVATVAGRALQRALAHGLPQGGQEPAHA